MTFRQLEYLEEISHAKSLSAAAAGLFISQSALSQQIGAMEREFNVRILDRKKSKPTFTPQGQKILTAAREILSVRRRLEQDLLSESDRYLCVKTVPFYASNLVPNLLSHLHQQHMEAQVMIKIDWAPDLFTRNTQEPVSLYVHAFDMEPLEPAIPAGGSLTHEVLFEEEILLAMSSRHPLLKRLTVHADAEGVPCVSLEDLKDQPFMIPATSPRLLSAACRYLNTNEHDTRLSVSENGFDLLIGHLQYTNYLTFLPNTTIRYCNSARGVRFFRILERQLWRPISSLQERRSCTMWFRS